VPVPPAVCVRRTTSCIERTRVGSVVTVSTDRGGAGPELAEQAAHLAADPPAHCRLVSHHDPCRGWRPRQIVARRMAIVANTLGVLLLSPEPSSIGPGFRRTICVEYVGAREHHAVGSTVNSEVKVLKTEVRGYRAGDSE
jgi:hypothetical protein